MNQPLTRLRDQARPRLAQARTLIGLPRKASRIERCLEELYAAETLLAAQAYHRGVGRDEAHLERTCPAWEEVQELRARMAHLMHSFLADLEQLQAHASNPTKRNASRTAEAAASTDRITAHAMAHSRELAEHFHTAYLGELTLRERHFLNSRFLDTTHAP